MKKYTVNAQVTISVYTVVEAKSVKEALKVAFERSMCHLTSPERAGETPDEVWCHSGEIDGTPVKLAVDEE